MLQLVFDSSQQRTLHVSTVAYENVKEHSVGVLR
jgi:hypothetical protein